MEVTKAEFARMAGVSRAAVGGKVKNGTLIENRAGMLDTDNPINRNYLNKKQNRTTELDNSVVQSLQADTHITSASKTPEVKTNQRTDNTPQVMLDMTLRDLVSTYGNMDGIERYVKVLRDLTTADEKTQRLQERRQMQIPRDFVISRLFGFINQLTNKILDVPDSLADQVIALVQSDSENCRQKIINYTRDVLARAIGGSKDHVINELTSLKSKYDDSENISQKIDELYEQQMDK